MAQRPRVESGSASRAVDAVRAALLSPIGIGIFTACCLVAAELRMRAGIWPDYPFVRWNLFLAWIPLVLAYAVSWAAKRDAWVVLPTIAAAWIIFLPNAPYLVTDLVHLRESVNIPNAITLSLLAMTGLLIGVKAVQLVQGAVEHLFGAAAALRAVQAVAVLTALGVYLGRVLRWNSWTVISHPRALAHAVLISPSEPSRVGLASLGTLAFAVAFYIAYRIMTGSAAHDVKLASAPARRRIES
jgi:uncharacterized membrane protein